MIVLYEHNGLFGILHFFQRGLSKLAIDFLVVLPIRQAEDGPGMRDMAKRPQALIGETIVITFFFFGAEPHAPQRIVRIVGGYPQPVFGVDHLAVGVGAAMRDPGSVTRPQDWSQSCD